MRINYGKLFIDCSRHDTGRWLMAVLPDECHILYAVTSLPILLPSPFYTFILHSAFCILWVKFESNKTNKHFALAAYQMRTGVGTYLCVCACVLVCVLECAGMPGRVRLCHQLNESPLPSSVVLNALWERQHNKSPSLKICHKCGSRKLFRTTEAQPHTYTHRHTPEHPHIAGHGRRFVAKVLAFKWLLLFCRMAPSGIIKNKGKSK